MKTRRTLTNRILPMLGLIFALTASVFAQTTEFTYQGRLLDNTMPPTANYDFQFTLFSAATGGTAIGTLQRSGVAVSNGIFTVKLDFGAQFDGTARFLEIAVKLSSSGSYTTLNPRQSVSSAPYNIRSLSAANADTAANSNQLGGIAPSGFIQNTTTPQTANFNVNGSGTVTGTLSGNTVNAATEYDIGNSRVLSIAGSNNLFAGVLAGQANTTGSNNAFFGSFSGRNNTTGYGNSFFGLNAGVSNTTGGFNTFIGSNAGVYTSTGIDNTFTGTEAGFSNTTGSENSFYGRYSGRFSVANNNSFFGNSSGYSNTSGNNNTFVGNSAGLQNTTASGETFIGADAGHENTTGTANTFVGSSAGYSNTTSKGNVFVGDQAGYSNADGNGSNVFVGSQAGYNNTAFNNSFFGFKSGFATTTGISNSFFGFYSGIANTTGDLNVFFGAIAGATNTTGTANTFVGSAAGSRSSTASFGTFVGTNAGSNNTTADFGTFIGNQAGLNNTTGTRNSMVGNNSGQANTTGGFNSFFGDSTGFRNTTGDSNVFVGQTSGSNNTSGASNVFVGRNSGLANTTESNNTFIGFSADGAAGITNATAIGANAAVTTSNTMVLGNANANYVVDVTGKLQIDSLATAGSTQLCLNGSNRVATCSSSFRYKFDIQNFNGGLDVVRRLQPISFAWKDNPNLRDVGFGAEAVEKIEPRLVTYRNGEIEGVKYSQITTVLVNAVNEQQTQIETQKTQIEQQQKQIDALKKLVCPQNQTAEICQEKQQ